jgi:hypothetical protein
MQRCCILQGRGWSVGLGLVVQTAIELQFARFRLSSSILPVLQNPVLQNARLQNARVAGINLRARVRGSSSGREATLQNARSCKTPDLPRPEVDIARAMPYSGRVPYTHSPKESVCTGGARSCKMRGSECHPPQTPPVETRGDLFRARGGVLHSATVWQERHSLAKCKTPRAEKDSRGCVRGLRRSGRARAWGREARDSRRLRDWTGVGQASRGCSRTRGLYSRVRWTCV